MKTASTDLKNILRNNVAVRAIPVLIAEWNYNRYATVSTVANAYSTTDPRPQMDQDTFPIKSIVEPNRPTRGIVKASAVGQSTGYSVWLQKTTSSFPYKPGDVRWYTADPNSLYKYWTSPYFTDTAMGAQSDYGFTPATGVQPYVVYAANVFSNKIVVGFENSWATPTRLVIQTTTDGTNWTTISTNPTVNANGQVILYRQSNGSWSATKSTANETNIRGVRVQVNALNRPHSQASVIEISARRENDLSAYLIDYDCEFTMDEPNFVTPLGKCSANNGSITLSNVDGRFSNENPSSTYYGMIKKNIRLTLDLVYDVTAGTESIRHFTMYSEEWAGEGEEEVTVNVKDSSKYFQDQDAPARLLQDVTVGEAVWRLCDTVGFVNYAYSTAGTAISTQIPYFWTDGEKTIWQVFQELAQATQTAIYFDEYDILQIRTRDAAFDETRAVDWDFTAVNAAPRLADIEEAKLERTYEANSVDVTYKNTKVSDFGTGLPVMEKVWEPEGAFVLRASPLYLENMNASQTSLRINPRQAETWPYEGMLAIDGELIKYRGKKYGYWSKTTNRQESVVIYSKEEKDYWDSPERTFEDKKYLNGFVGDLMNLERGFKGTWATTHATKPKNMSVTATQLNQTNTVSRGVNAYIVHNQADSTITLGPAAPRGASDWVSAHATYTGGGIPVNFGTRFKFTEAGYHKPGGMFLMGGAADSGYYIEFFTSKIREEVPDLGGARNEIGIVRRLPNGVSQRATGVSLDENGQQGPPIPVIGVPFNIVPDVWYDLDVKWAVVANNYHGIWISINGKYVAYFEISNTVTPSTDFGVWCEAPGQMKFEYLYAHEDVDDSLRANDSDPIQDQIKGGYASGRWNQFVYKNYRNTNDWDTYVRYNPQRFYFDEFGAVAHEVREMDVAFEKFPAIHSRLYFSNDSQVMCPEYIATPFGASFILANRSRYNAIVSGEDKITFGEENPVDQKIMVYGRLVFQEDEETITVKNEASIREKGKISVTIQNDWIQNKAEAQSLADWIVNNWPSEADQVQLTVFGNPLIQLGDLVTVNYPARSMAPATHKYFVVGVAQEFSEGLGTSINLRRANI